MDKTCFKCLKVKPIEFFYKHPKMADGHLNKCIECTKKDAAIHRIKNIEKIREYDNTRSKKPERIQYSKKNAIAWNKKHPEKYQAHNMLNNCIRDGKIKKPSTCEICGKSCSLHGHHFDYDKPLDVIWLCPECHAQIK